MMRARDHGKIVYRHMSGLLRVVRGRLMLKSVNVAALGRSSITATFMCDTIGPDDPPPLHDAHLVHADDTRLVLSGCECIAAGPGSPLRPDLGADAVRRSLRSRGILRKENQEFTVSAGAGRAIARPCFRAVVAACQMLIGSRASQSQEYSAALQYNPRTSQHETGRRDQTPYRLVVLRRGLRHPDLAAADMTAKRCSLYGPSAPQPLACSLE
jgi:hypothetical protein